MFNHTQIDINTIPPLHCACFDDVTLVPMVGDILSQKSDYALGAFVQKKPLHHVRRMKQNETRYHQLPYIKAWKTSPQEVIYGGMFFMHWGHFLLENLQRLWYAQKHTLPIVWVGVHGFAHTPSEFAPWQSALFQALGIHNEHIFLTEPTQFAKVYFPEPGSGINTHMHPEQAHFLSHYEAKPQQGTYVYFSRAKIRSCANEEQLETILKKRGWRIIYPETLSVEEQLQALSTAKVCFMIGGSAQHSLLFTKNLQTRFIIIPREHSETFNIIANTTSNNYYLFHVQKTTLHSDGTDEANDTFTLDTSTIEQVLEKTKDFTKNIHLYTDILSKPPELTPAQLNVPAMYYEAPQPVSKAEKYYYHAHFLYKQKKYRAAYKIFKHLEKKHLLEDFMYPDFFMALQQYQLQKGYSLTLPIEKYQHQIQELQEEIARTPCRLPQYKKLTELFLVTGQIDAALRIQTQLAQRNPLWSEPLAQIAFIYAAQNNFAQAIVYATKAAEAEPQNLTRKGELARYLLTAKEYDACKKLMTQTLLRHPTWEEAYIHLASAHYAQGALDKALACATKASTMAPHNREALEQLATYKRQKGDQGAAVELLAKALQCNPRAAERFAQNAAIYAHKGEFNSAVKYARKAVELEPRNFVCKALLATYLRQNAQYEECKALMEDALHINPFWSEPFAQFAAICEAQNKLDEAIDYARKAVATEPYDIRRKQELEHYRVKKITREVEQSALPSLLHARRSPLRTQVQHYLDIFYARTYLEIGLCPENIFDVLDVPCKIAVTSACWNKDVSHKKKGTHIFREDSEVFFAKLPSRRAIFYQESSQKNFVLDSIFLHGAATFEQTLREFDATLPYSHEKTLWMFKAPRISEKSSMHHTLKMQSRDESTYKAIFAIHDTYPEFSYCSIAYGDSALTLVWRTATPTQRTRVFESLEVLAHTKPEELSQYGQLMHYIPEQDVLSTIFTNTPKHKKV